jgi:hypothetical protein
MAGSTIHRVGMFVRILARSLIAALAVEGGVFAAAMGYSSAVCDSDKLTWGLLLAVYSPMSPYPLALWVAAVAVTTFALPTLTSRFGWLRTLVCIGIAWIAIFGVAWALSAWLARPGCSMLI